MGLFVQIYSWISEYLFAGVSTLPEIVQSIVPQICTLVSLFSTALIILVPCWIIYMLCRIVFSWGRL